MRVWVKYSTVVFDLRYWFSTTFLCLELVRPLDSRAMNVDVKFNHFSSALSLSTFTEYSEALIQLELELEISI